MKAHVVGGAGPLGSNPGKAVKGTVWAVGAFYLLIAFEFFYMATPFAAYFYGAYLPGLEALNRIPVLGWLTSFFLPHYAETSSALVDSAAVVGGLVTATGILGFSIGAIQVYSRKLLRRGAAVGGVYRWVRHPQYASLILAGTGMLLLWPRLLMVVFFVTMLFAYHALAAIEERECLGRFGQAYAEYRARTPRFLPLRMPRRRVRVGGPPDTPRATRWLAWVLGYAAALSSALGLTLALQAYTLRHLYTATADDAVYLALTPLAQGELRRVVQRSTADSRVRARLDRVTGPRARFIDYVMPWEWAVPEIPMNELDGHRAPGDYDRRRHKIVITKAVLRGDPAAQGLDILRRAKRTEFVAEAWLDSEGRVTRVLGPPATTFYGVVPVPVF
jgi:protein-S-isoprenylcysteine O-methyltransferase Ste14